MKNLRFWLHACLLVSFALPWLKVPLFFTSVTITGFLLPYQTSHLAQELAHLGIIEVTNDQMLPMYLILLAPLLSLLILCSLFMKRPMNGYYDSIVGFLAVMSCLYILTNTGNIISIGLYVTLIVSMILVASPLVVSGTHLRVKGTNASQSVPDTH